MLIMIAIAVYQVPGLLRQKQWRELAAFALMWLVAGVYALLTAMRFPLPTLVEALTFIYEILPIPF